MPCFLPRHVDCPREVPSPEPRGSNSGRGEAGASYYCDLRANRADARCFTWNVTRADVSPDARCLGGLRVRPACVFASRRSGRPRFRPVGRSEAELRPGSPPASGRVRLGRLADDDQHPHRAKPAAISAVTAGVAKLASRDQLERLPELGIARDHLGPRLDHLDPALQPQLDRLAEEALARRPLLSTRARRPSGPAAAPGPGREHRHRSPGRQPPGARPRTVGTTANPLGMLEMGLDRSGAEESEVARSSRTAPGAGVGAAHAGGSRPGAAVLRLPSSSRLPRSRPRRRGRPCGRPLSSARATGRPGFGDLGRDVAGELGQGLPAPLPVAADVDVHPRAVSAGVVLDRGRTTSSSAWRVAPRADQHTEVVTVDMDRRRRPRRSRFAPRPGSPSTAPTRR